MPSYAHLTGALDCPACGRRLDVPYDLVAFQWGYCASRQPYDDLFYRIGDAIRWRFDDVDALPAWTYFDGVLQGGNLGDPSYEDVIVRVGDLGGNDFACSGCQHVGFALRIERGRIVALVPAVPGCDIAIVRDNSEPEPRPDWDDAAMTIVSVVNRKLTDSKLAPGDGDVVAT